MLSTPSFRLDHKKALVIGASSGIGQACAVALGEYGAEVTVAARRKEHLEHTVKLIEQHQGKAHSLVMDISDMKKTQSTIEALSDPKPFDILINAAGMARNKSALETTEEDFDSVIQLNIKSAYFIAKTVAQTLINAKRQGSLITISSQMGHTGGIDRSVYSASKHAIEGMTKSMAIEWAPYGIRVNTICPTFIKTELTAPTFDNPERVKWIKEKIKLGRIGEVQDIMGAALFLASDASALMTGTSLLIDGGWTAG